MGSVNKPPSRPQRLVDMSFDQYSRQFLVKKLVEKALRSGDKRLNIIDLGGHKGKTQEFFPTDKITILDVFDEKYAGYVKGDATNMTFKDNAFDIACSFDVFEHIPRPKRQKFVTEALRVSKLGVFIAMPVDDEHELVSHAEKTLNDLHRQLYGEDHRWLKEHIDYRIPTSAEVEKLLKKADAHFTSFGSNQITNWQLLQMMIFVAARNPLATTPAQELNEWYNRHLTEVEKGVSIGYRRIYFITRDPKLKDHVASAVQKLSKMPSETEKTQLIPVHQAVLEQTMQAVAASSKSFLKALKQKEDSEVALTQQLREVHQLLQNQDKSNVVLREELVAVYASTSWRVTRPLRALMKFLRKIG
jgi:ubiquinone/menaquinone biosynthesis C-methylase UbiE